jgi:hypothetical protein
MGVVSDITVDCKMREENVEVLYQPPKLQPAISGVGREQLEYVWLKSTFMVETS